jgi:hypothetical protein
MQPLMSRRRVRATREVILLFKSPLAPLLLKGGIFFLPLFGKEGLGEIF